MNRRVCTVIAALAMLAGCATTTTYHQSRSNIFSPEDISTLVLDLGIDADKIYLVDTVPDSAERLGLAGSVQAAAASSAQSTPLSPGTSTGEAMAGSAIGMVIGVQLVKLSQDYKEQSAANSKVLPILGILPKAQLAETMRTTLLQQANAQQAITFLNSSDTPRNTLLAEPELRFNSDLSRIEVKLNATIRDGISRDLLYQNTFEYWSRPISSQNNCEENCSLWAAENARLLNQYLQEGCAELVDMLLHDLGSTLRPEPTAATPQKTHKITCDRGTVFMRGSTVKVGPDRVWLKDLRGNLRSIYGSL